MQVQSRYQNGKVYKLVNCVDDKIYIGSTCARLSKRIYDHKLVAKKRPAYVHKHLNSIGWENVRIILIENVIAETKDQLLIREQHYIDELKPEFNENAAYVDCPHGRTHSRCVDCHGAGICEHNRIQSTCKDCGGSQICEHNRIQSTCKDCGGSRVCEHNRIQSTCKDCGGSQICEHGRIQSQCKDCGGSQVREHNRIKTTYKDCGGSRMCEHNRQKAQCKDCGGSRICEHNRQKAQCVDCNCDKYKCIICNHVFCSANILNRHRRSVKHAQKINEFFNTYNIK